MLSNQWAKSCFADFIQSLVELKSPNQAAMKVERYFPFFAKIDTIFSSLDSLNAYALLDNFGPEGLRLFSMPYDYLSKEGLITPLTRDEINADSEKRAHINLINKADGKWYEKDVLAFYNHLETMAKRYADRGWKGDLARFKPRTITAALRAAILFYDHADAYNITSTRQVDQNIIDEFIYANPGYKNSLRALIRYINRHGKIFRKLKVEFHGRNIDANAFIPPKKYSDLIKKFLASEGKDTKKALIGIFMIMYAQPASRLVKLRMSDVLKGENGTFRMLFGEVELDLEPRIGDLFDRYLEHRHALSVMERDLDNEWLFPGRKYGCHISTAAVSCMIKEFGVTADQMYATAIFNFYQSGMRHPKVLVRAFGISVVTAIKYLKMINPRMFEEAESRQHAS
ncbi:hypothetical protein AL013_02690 [Mariprofundus ferrooxydans]|nr:hypothetical protein AL013_02690 [Mariprofundus ferrooxydans]